MANLKEIRNRISSVSSTKQITSAMKLVSAAKLKKAQDAILRFRPYANKLHEVLSDISSSLDSAEDNIYAQSRDTEKLRIIMVTGNRGLCGGFNSAVTKKITALISEDYKKLYTSGDISFTCIGKKGSQFLKSKDIIESADTNEHIIDKPAFADISVVAENAMEEFRNKEVDKVLVVYNKFKNAAVQELTVEQFLPIAIPEGDNFAKDYIYEPGKDEIIHDLIPKSLKTQLFKAVLDSVAAEHGARMTAMHKATDNATELIKELKLGYNKARQSAITNEILEIVGGAEALNG